MNGTPRRLLRRLAQTTQANSNVAASANAAQVICAQMILPTIDPTQAFRLIRGAAKIADANQTHFLTVLGSALVLAVSLDNLGINYHASNFAPVLIGATGVRFSFIDDEYVYGNDFVDLIPTVGGKPGVFNLTLMADITNSDAAIHAVAGSITVLMEVWQLEI